MIISNLFAKLSLMAQALGQVRFPRRFAPAILALCLAMSSILPGAGQLALAQQAAPAPEAQTVNINKADASTLASALNGVGPSRAEEIVRYRETYGPFKTLEELAEVDGIGLSTLNKNRKAITLD